MGASAPQSEPWPTVPGYRIEAVLGRGSAGVVYRAVQLAVERPVALKVLHADVAARARSVRRLQREARITARLAHPGIVTAIDMGEVAGAWWYAMELVDGPSLQEKLKADGPMSERDALRFFIPLCEALEHAADAGVIHRDLKPANILVDSSGRARIVDLGLALREDDPTASLQGGTLGTPHYISPEQARNAASADARSDIWSLGATMYHCLCGRPPFAGASVAAILSGVLYAPIPDPAELAPQLSRNMVLVLRKCLSRDPARRYQHPRELREDLERIRERRGVTVERAELEPLAGERERRRTRWIVASSVVGGVAIAALVVLQPWRREEASATASAESIPFAPLDELERRAALPNARVAPLLERLDEIAGAVPAEHAARVASLRASLGARLDTELVAARSTLEAELDRLWNRQRDFSAALAWLEVGFEAQTRERLGLSAKQWVEVAPRFTLAERQRAVDDDRRVSLGVLQQRLARHYTEVVQGARARALLEEGRWAAARAMLDTRAEALVRETASSTVGYTAGDVEAVLRAIESELVRPAVAALEERWRVEDRRRAAELQKQHDTLLEEIELGRTSDVRQRVDELYAQSLAQARVRADELLSDVSDELRRSRDALVAELDVVAARARLRVAESLLADNLADLDVRWRARRFRAIAEQFDALSASPALQPVRARCASIAEQARVLEDVLQRAAATLQAASGTERLVELPIGALTFRGRVEEAQQVLERGFRFRPSDAPASVAAGVLALRELDSGKGTLVSRGAVESLAGLGGKSLGADARFEAALLRWHSGDRAEAAQLVIEPPSRPEWGPIAAELAGWIEGERAKSADDARARVDRARLSLNKVRTATSGGAADVRSQLEWIDELLTRQLDLDFVAAEAEWLRARRAELRKALDVDDKTLLQRAYGPTELSLGETGAVRMRWVLDASYSGPFQRGEWLPDGEGWIAPRPATRDAVADERSWPTLFLQPPLRLGDALELSVTFDQPAQSGQPRLFSVSVAGVHVVLLGAAEIGQKGRWKIGSGNPEAYGLLLTELLDRNKGTEFEPLQKGGRHVLRIELKQGRGDVSVYLDGRLLGRDTPVRPDPSTYGDKSVIVRSLEPVRLRELELSGRCR